MVEEGEEIAHDNKNAPGKRENIILILMSIFIIILGVKIGPGPGFDKVAHFDHKLVL